MSRWNFEPGHTAATFRTRHMVVTWVRGIFTGIHGWLGFEPEHAMETAFEGDIDATTIWTGEPNVTLTCAALTSSTLSTTQPSG